MYKLYALSLSTSSLSVIIWAKPHGDGYKMQSFASQYNTATRLYPGASGLITSVVFWTDSTIQSSF